MVLSAVETWPDSQVNLHNYYVLTVKDHNSNSSKTLYLQACTIILAESFKHSLKTVYEVQKVHWALLIWTKVFEESDF